MTEIDQRVTKIRAYCEAMASRYLAMRRRMAMLQPLAYDKNLVGRYNEAKAGLGLLVLREALLLGLTDDLMVLTQDRDDRTASLVNIVRLLQSPDLKEATKADFCKSFGSTDQERNRERSQRQAAEFDALWLSVVKGTDDLVNSEIGKKLKNIRDKVSSHYEMTSSGEEPRPLEIADFDFKWGDPEQYAEEAKKVIFDTVLLVSNSHYDL
jgi:hypothetical protein